MWRAGNRDWIRSVYGYLGEKYTRTKNSRRATHVDQSNVPTRKTDFDGEISSRITRKHGTLVRNQSQLEQNGASDQRPDGICGK